MRGPTRPEGAALAVLLVVGAVVALARSLGGSPITRLGAYVVAVIIVSIAAGSARGRPWALGSAFFLGLFWLWAASALGVQGQLPPGEAALWLAWSVAVMVTSVRARPVRKEHLGA